MTFKISMLLCAALITLCAFFAYRNQALVITKNTLVIGTVGNYAPFVSMNAEGQYEGFDIDVATLLAQKLGKELIIKDLGSMAPLFIALEQGSIDAIIWGLSITQARCDKVAMVRYQGETVISYPLMFWQEIPQGIKSLNDMQGMTVCVEPASSQDAVLSTYPLIVKQCIERVDDALLNIQYGKAQAAFVEPAIARKFKAKYPEIYILDIELAPDMQVKGTGIAIKKVNTDLISDITKAIDELLDAGIIQQLEAQWGIV